MAGICCLRTAVRSLSQLGVLRSRSFGAAALQYDYYDDDDEYEPYSDRLRKTPMADHCGSHGGRGVQWVLIGNPGVQKHVYAARLSKLLEVPHISMGSLVRQELNPRSSLYKQMNNALSLINGPHLCYFSGHWMFNPRSSEMTDVFPNSNLDGFVVSGILVIFLEQYPEIANAVNEGKLVPEDIIFGLLSKRLEDGYYSGETGFILEGLPRTRIQAEILDQIADIDLVVNFKCREDCLLKKHLGSGMCTCCGGSLNMSTSESIGLSQYMNQLKPSSTYLEGARKEKLRIYSEQSKPLEDHYRKQKKLLDFEVAGEPGETWRGLLAALHLKHRDVDSPQKLTA